MSFAPGFFVKEYPKRKKKKEFNFILAHFSNRKTSVEWFKIIL